MTWMHPDTVHYLELLNAEEQDEQDRLRLDKGLLPTRGLASRASGHADRVPSNPQRPGSVMHSPGLPLEEY